MASPAEVEAMKFLAVSPEQKMKDAAIPFDAKKFVWVPTPKDDEAGYVKGEIESTDGDMVTVSVNGGVRISE